MRGGWIRPVPLRLGFDGASRLLRSVPLLRFRKHVREGKLHGSADDDGSVDSTSPFGGVDSAEARELWTPRASEFDG